MPQKNLLEWTAVATMRQLKMRGTEGDTTNSERLSNTIDMICHHRSSSSLISSVIFGFSCCSFSTLCRLIEGLLERCSQEDSIQAAYESIFILVISHHLSPSLPFIINTFFTSLSGSLKERTKTKTIARTLDFVTERQGDQVVAIMKEMEIDPILKAMKEISVSVDLVADDLIVSLINRFDHLLKLMMLGESFSSLIASSLIKQTTHRFSPNEICDVLTKIVNHVSQSLESSSLPLYERCLDLYKLFRLSFSHCLTFSSVQHLISIEFSLSRRLSTINEWLFTNIYLPV